MSLQIQRIKQLVKDFIFQKKSQVMIVEISTRRQLVSPMGNMANVSRKFMGDTYKCEGDSVANVAEKVIRDYS